VNLIMIALAALIALGGSLGAGTKGSSPASKGVVAPVKAAAPAPTDSPAPTPMDIVGSGGPSNPTP